VEPTNKDALRRLQNLMSRRTLLLALVFNIAVTSMYSWAQGANKIPVLGMMAPSPHDPAVEGLRQGLHELGYVEGRNFRFEFRTDKGQADRLPRLAQELVQLNVDVIVVANTPAALAVKRATSTIPIVFSLVADPVGSGLVTNLAHPGGNITGNSLMTTEISAKRLQLLKELIPRLTRVAVLWNPDNPTHLKMIEEIKAAAPSLSLELSFVPVRTPEDFDAAFSAVSRTHAQALYLLENSLFYSHRLTLVKLVSKARLPAIYGGRVFADEGGLMSYGANYEDLMRRSAGYIEKILKGTKPGDLPIQQPTKFELVVNLNTARSLFITIPESILSRADEVIR
jgi:putative ABC transport system substrate-binding protein